MQSLLAEGIRNLVITKTIVFPPPESPDWLRIPQAFQSLHLVPGWPWKLLVPTGTFGVTSQLEQQELVSKSQPCPATTPCTCLLSVSVQLQGHTPPFASSTCAGSYGEIHPTAQVRHLCVLQHVPASLIPSVSSRWIPNPDVPVCSTHSPVAPPPSSLF